MMKQHLSFAIYSVLFLIGMVTAQYGGGGSGGGGGGGSYGLSNMSINVTTLRVAPGGSANGAFNITLYSGIAYSTQFSVVNGGQLQYNSGITILATPTQGNPTYSGTFKVSVSKSTAPGTYKALVSATGGDPSNNALLLNIIVPSSVNTTSTISSTTVANAPTNCPLPGYSNCIIVYNYGSCPPGYVALPVPTALGQTVCGMKTSTNQTTTQTTTQLATSTAQTLPPVAQLPQWGNSFGPNLVTVIGVYAIIAIVIVGAILSAYFILKGMKRKR